MKILMLNGSPKRRFSTSQYFLGLLKIQMAGCKTKEIKLTGTKVYDEIFSHFKTIDVLVIAMPVYVDAVPSHVLDFLTEAETFCKRENCNFKLYVISNCGFYEGKQCKNLLAVMRSFCNAAGLEWGAGLGIGGGEMLSILRLTMPIFIFTQLLLSLPIFMFKDGLLNGLANYDWISVIVSMLIFLAFNFGLFYSLFKMQTLIRKGKTALDFFTGVTCCPRFLFTMFACAYWVIRAAFHGTGLWQLYQKEKK
jgi:hypothetical protein